jgi:hypothetical protein
MTEHKKIIVSEIEKALVKIWVNSELKGTGFFITPDGDLLTAYHCVKDYNLGIKLETSAGGEPIKAQLDEDNSLKKFDIAVLKTTSTPPSHCIPIGNVSGKVQASDEIVVLGHHAYSGKISRFLKPHKIELSDSVGESGSPVFHYATKRIIGLTLGERQAICFTPLFAIWEELGEMSDEVAKAWDERLRQMLAKTNNQSQTAKQQDFKKERLATLRQQWELLNQKRAGLENQKILETRIEEKIRLESLIAETNATCGQLEEEINALES